MPRNGNKPKPEINNAMAESLLSDAMRDMCKLLDLMQGRSKFDKRWKGAYARLEAIFNMVDEASTRQAWATAAAQCE